MIGPLGCELSFSPSITSRSITGTLAMLSLALLIGAARLKPPVLLSGSVAGGVVTSALLSVTCGSTISFKTNQMPPAAAAKMQKRTKMIMTLVTTLERDEVGASVPVEFNVSFEVGNSGGVG